MAMLNRIIAGVCWALLFLPNLIWQTARYSLFGIRVSAKREKKDILERANWLAGKMLVSPERLLSEMPSILGKHFGGEWAIYSCSHYAAALLNISRLYPEEKALCLERMERIIDIVLDPAIREYDTMKWSEDALETLSGNKSHMTYLSILAWIITCYKMAGGTEKHDAILHGCCEALDRRIRRSRDLNLLSFPHTPIFFPDMLFCIVALHNYSLLFDGKYADTVQLWLHKAKTEWTDKHTGLLFSMLYRNKNGQYSRHPSLRGSYSALNCYCLSLIDDDYAKDQYIKMKCWFRNNRFLTGIREYKNWTPFFRMDVDAGPVINGLSPSGTAWAIGCATFFNDRHFKTRLLRSGDIAGITVRGWKKRHYILGSIVIVGEAVTLAMRTNYQFKNESKVI